MSPKNNLLSLAQAKMQMAALIAAYKPSTTIYRIEIKIHPIDMIAWLSCQQDRVKVYGANQSDTMSIAGLGEAVCVTGKRRSSFKEVLKKLRSYLLPAHPYLQWYGGFCFDQSHQDKDWKEFGAYRFILPRFELAAQSGRMIFCCNLVGRENIKEILAKLDAIIIPSKSAILRNKFPAIQRKDLPNRNQWCKGVGQVLMSGKSLKKVVLARKTSLYFKQAPNPWAMMQQLKAVTPNSYHFAFQFNKTVFLGASPERLFRRYQRLIESEALAGTMPKRANPKILQDSVKNQYEHALVVEAINGSLKDLCIQYHHSPKPSVLTLPNGHHLITKFQGQLKDSVKDEDILQYLHPTPALGGTPRKRAMAAIRQLEQFSRGWYGAPVGYVGLDWAEFVVGIRSGLVQDKRLSVFAGAGIVKGSEPLNEWDEVENKISNFIKIIR